MTDTTEQKTPINPFPKMEEDVLNFWDKAKIFQKSVERDAPKGDYVFYDGPPFATGTPHYGHFVPSLIKDVVPRYWTMRGFRVERRWGWDCHGLPIENIAEKELGFTHKKDILKYGIDKFNEFCRSKVLSYVDVWKVFIRRLGRWADMENSYHTMDLNYMESVWWVFKELWDKGLIYEGYRPIHVCPRCETTLSQQEVSENYKDIKDISVTAKFELIDEPGTFVLAWTTTPWTLIGNVALAVGEHIDYVKIPVKDQDTGKNEILILSEARWYYYKPELLKKYPGIGHIKQKISGQELIGKKYKPLFDYYSRDQTLINKDNGWKIYAAKFVTLDEGTGVVHIAPAFGEDDLNLGKQYNLPFVQHVNLDGTIKAEATGFAGLSVKPQEDHTKTDIEIIKYLGHKGLLLTKEKYEHSYPHCWRCETPLINYVTASWFVNVLKVKDQALKLAEQINWSPGHIKEGRFGNWLAGARDWSISRQRFWASVIPIWRCVCGEIKVFGSVKDLEAVSGQKITDLHKHKVDQIIFPCQKCGGEMHRIGDVLDTWFDSGSMPYAQMHYPFENQEKFENNFPAKFIGEAVDQTRAWFYYLHILGTAIKNKPAFQNAIVNGIVLAEDGKKMSKHLKNYPDPFFIFDKYGADAIRYYLLSSSVMMAENLNFAEKGVGEALRKNIMIVWNVYKFYEMFAGQKLYSADRGEPVPENVLDKWILIRFNQLVQEVTGQMECYDLPRAIRPIADFINDLSTWYLRRSRDRFRSDSQGAASETLQYILIELSKVMAPFMPFISENLWQKVTNNNFQNEDKSVHLEVWPVIEGKLKNDDQQILETMALIRKIIELGLAEREKAGIKIRQPLESLIINGAIVKLEGEYLDLIKDEVNVKKLIQKIDSSELSVQLDTTMTEELKMEGLKRELVRHLNSLRKDASLTVHDKVAIFYETEDELLHKVFQQFSRDIEKDTLAGSIRFGFADFDAASSIEPGQIVKEIKIEKALIKVGLKKV